MRWTQAGLQDVLADFRVCVSPGSQFHAFYWACFTVSTTALPRAPTLVLGPTSKFFDFSSLYYLMAYFAGWEADSGHSQPMLILMVYILELALRWMMAAAVAAASIPPLHAEFAWLCRTDPKGRKVKVKVIP